MAQTLPARVADAMRRLRAAVTLTGPDDVPTLVTAVAAAVGASEIVIYLADYPQTRLVPLAAGTSAELPIETTLAGRAYISLEVRHASEHPDRLWVPLVDGCERLGVLELVAPAVVITAILEPCYDVGGDVFDYALDGDLLSFALFDTCGHGIAASTLAALTINAYRNARRGGPDLVDTTAAIDMWLRRRHPNQYVRPRKVPAELFRCPSVAVGCGCASERPPKPRQVGKATDGRASPGFAAVRLEAPHQG